MKRFAMASSLLLLGVIAGTACTKQETAAPPPSPAGNLGATGTVSVNTPPPATTIPAAPAAPPPAANAVATAEAETSGVRAVVTEFKRTSGGTVSLKFTMVNDSASPVSFGYTYTDRQHEVTDFGGIGGVHLIDPVGKKKYFVARDSENKCVCSQKVADIPRGGRANLWAKFPAPPEDVKQLTIVIPKFEPLDDVPLS
jgi:hypothetical protein